jgi:hypothetical protein
MFEHRNEPLLPRRKYVRRVAKHGLFAFVLIAISLAIGIVGYHFLEGLGWIDATVNASMILGGMGPVNRLHTDAGKLFASAYALFSGIIFLAAVAVLFAPAFHRFLHKFHLDSKK